jgi:AcrR family transcriptional regulator
MPELNKSTSKPDGRRMRSDRSRQLIIESMLELIKQGNLVPTAQQVADHANVGIRSVFRHFEDMESIFETTNELCHKEYRGLFIGGDRSGTLKERILHATECHANAFETMSNMILSGAARRWNSKVLKSSYIDYQNQLGKDLDEWLPELKCLSENRRQAIDGIASFEMWHRLRSIQSLSKPASIAIIVEMLEVLIIP